MSTYFPKAGEIARKWYVVDASGQTLGRLASQVARILMGKENPKYTPFLDTGDHVIVIANGLQIQNQRRLSVHSQCGSSEQGTFKTVGCAMAERKPW